MADYARTKEFRSQPFELKAFFDELNSHGNIPISFGHWQMTGVDDYVRKISNNY